MSEIRISKSRSIEIDASEFTFTRSNIYTTVSFKGSVTDADGIVTTWEIEFPRGKFNAEIKRAGLDANPD